MSQVSNYYDSVRRELLTGPLCAQLEISGKCQSRCVACMIHTTQGMKYHPTYEQVIHMIDTLAESGVRAIRLTGGEPVMAERFPDIVQHMRDLKIYTSMTTTLLTKKKDVIEALLNVQKFKLSLPCVGDEYHNYFCIPDKNFDTVKANMDFLREHKRKFSVNYTIFDKNYGLKSIMKFINFINPYKPNYVTFFPALEYDHKDSKAVVSNFKACRSFCEFKSNIDTIEKHFKRRKERAKIVCHINKFHWHVKRNGDAYPCCMTGGEIGNDLDPQFLMGNLFEQSATEIYVGKFDMFKGKNLAKAGICANCTQRYLMLNEEFDKFCFDDTHFSEL